MASFPEKYAAGSYTVNTGHAKCPDHLYLIDEGSGTTLTDRGKTGGLNMTITNATWQTDDLTAGGGTSPVLQFDGTGDYAQSDTGFSIVENALLIVIFKTTDATAPSSNSTVISIANSANSSDWAMLRVRTGDGYAVALYDDITGGPATRAGSASVCDQAWHMGVARLDELSSTSVQAALSLDGSTITTATGTFTETAWGFNRIAIADNAGSVKSSEFKGRIAAAFIYKDTADPANDWNQTFIDSLYANPWQFLNTGIPDLKLSVAPASNPGTKIYMTWET